MSSLDCELCGESFTNVELFRRHSIACKNKHCPSCSVCFETSGRMIKCSQCQVTVHPNCLGVRCIESTNTFKCQPCNDLQDPTKIKCELCPNYGGILIPIQNKLKQWVHISCCLWLPNIIISKTNNKLYANTANLTASKVPNNACIHCNLCTGKQLFCLICGIHCHVTCCSQSNFLLNMVPLQEYILWDTSRVCLWLKTLKLYSLIDIFNKYNIDGLSLGELTENEMQNILNIPSHHILTLQTEIRKIQQINLHNLGAQQYQTLRCVWSLCSKHRNIPFSQAMFIKLWNKHNNSSATASSGDDDDGDPDGDRDDEDEPKCMGCGGTTDEEHFLLCDNDEIAEKHGAHLYCLSPPLASIPKHDWFCPSCANTKYISKACLYCNSKMYNLNKKNLIHCKKCNCNNICHYNCAMKVNELAHNMKWKCPQCLNKKVIKLMHKNNKLLLANSTKLIINTSTTKKKNYIDWNLFEIIEANELCSVGESCKKYREKKKHYHCKDPNCMTRNGTPWFSERINSVEIHQQKHLKKKKIKLKSLKFKQNKITSKKSQFIETESENENDNDTELQSDTDIIKIPKYKNKNQPKLVDEHHGILHTFLQTANSDNISMRRRASSINKYILDRTNEFSKSIITQWIKQHRGDEKLSIWLQKAMVKLTNPKIEHKSKKEAEKLILDILAVITKAKILKIDWTPRSKLLDIITSIINNSRLNIVIIQKAKQCKLLFPSSLFINKIKAKKKSNVVSSKRVLKSNSKNVFDPCFEEDMHSHIHSNMYDHEDEDMMERICIKIKDFVGGKELDWHEIIYGRYGSIKTEHEQKYNVNITLRDGVNDGKVLKPGFDINKYHRLYVVIVGENRRQIGEAVESYRRIIDKIKERNSGGRDRYHDRERDRDRDRERNRNRNRDRERDRKKRDREHRSRDRHRHRDRERDRDRYYDRHRHRDKDKDKDKDKDRDKHKEHKDKITIEEKQKEKQKDLLDPRKMHIHKQDKQNKQDDEHKEMEMEMNEILWLRVQSSNNFGDVEYYFWNRITNETSWSEPKYWKDYEMESTVNNGNGNNGNNGNNGGGILHSLESVLSSADQHLQTINSKEDDEHDDEDRDGDVLDVLDVDTNEDMDIDVDVDVDVGEDDATKELLKLTSEFNKEIDDIEMTNNSLGHQLNVATDYLNTLKRQQNKTENESANINPNGINLYDSLSQSVKKRRDTSSSNSSSKSKRSRKKSLRESISSSDSTQSQGLYGYEDNRDSNSNRDSKRGNKSSRESKHRDRDRNRNRNRDRDRDRERDSSRNRSRNNNNQNNNSNNNNDDRSYGHKDRQRRNHRKYDRR